MPRASIRLAVISLLAMLFAGSPLARGGVLIIGADYPAWTGEIRSTLIATGRISGSIDIFDARTGTPSLALLQNYDAVLVYSNFVFNSRGLLGNRLADYVDAGGGVVEMPYATNSGAYGLGGRWQGQDYHAWRQGGIASGVPLTLGGVLDPLHPLMNGVGSFSGGSGSWHSRVGALTPGSQLVANWSNGRGLVAYNDTRAGTVVGLNFFPASSQSRSDFWNSNSDGAILIANALNFAGARSVPEPTAVALLSALTLGGVGIRHVQRRRQRRPAA